MKISISPSRKSPTSCYKTKPERSISNFGGFGRVGWAGNSLRFSLFLSSLGMLSKTMLHPLVFALGVGQKFPLSLFFQLEYKKKDIKSITK